MLAIFLATYGAVFVAEIVGDKLLYTTGVLATRYRSASIVCGMAAAFMLKMGVAVAIGDAIAHLPRVLVATVTAASFVGVAITLWRKPDIRKPKEKDARILQGAMVAFADDLLLRVGRRRHDHGRHDGGQVRVDGSRRPGRGEQPSRHGARRLARRGIRDGHQRRPRRHARRRRARVDRRARESDATCAMRRSSR